MPEEKKEIFEIPNRKNIDLFIRNRRDKFNAWIKKLKAKDFTFKELPEIIIHKGVCFRLNSKGDLLKITKDEARCLLQGAIFSIAETGMRAEIMLCNNGEVKRVLGIPAKLEKKLGFVPETLGE